ncbi:hypothetical protein TNCV_360881 [Trichonephila clavipes]|nr:hypothetical protein TNCV_360881 [Trichonephila clavipes]
MAVGSKRFGLGSLPGMIHCDVHDFGIAAIPGNRGNGQFDRRWLALVMKHVVMSKIGWLTQNRHVASNSRMILGGKRRPIAQALKSPKRKALLLWMSSINGAVREGGL